MTCFRLTASNGQRNVRSGSVARACSNDQRSSSRSTTQAVGSRAPLISSPMISMPPCLGRTVGRRAYSRSSRVMRLAMSLERISRADARSRTGGPPGLQSFLRHARDHTPGDQAGDGRPSARVADHDRHGRQGPGSADRCSGGFSGREASSTAIAGFGCCLHKPGADQAPSVPLAARPDP